MEKFPFYSGILISIYATAVSLIFISPNVLYAVPPDSPYLPGETLDPGCSPGGTNCSVNHAPDGSAGNIQFQNYGYFGSATDLTYATTTGNFGIGTSSPYAKLSVTGEALANFFTATSTSATSTLPNLSTTNIDTAFTKGSVIFADAQGILAEDNTNFKYTNSTNSLFLGGDLDFGATVGIDNTTYVRFSDINNDLPGELTMAFNSENADQSVTWLGSQSGGNADITLSLGGVGTETYTFPDYSGTLTVSGASMPVNFGTVTGSTFTATSATATSTFPNLYASQQFRLGSDYVTDLTGTGLSVSAGVLSVDSSASSYWVDGTGFLYPKDGDYAAAPYFTATSTSATSTFAGGLTVGTTTVGSGSGQLALDGAFTINSSNGAIVIGDTSGDARGNGSIDVQSSRSASTQVSSGVGSSAFGINNISSGLNASAYGYNNTASNSTASAFGYINTASASGASAFGLGNIASASGASAFGRSVTASASNAQAFGVGFTNSVSDSVAIGYFTPALYTISGGNVGIGTSSPFTKLAVTGTVTANNFNATSTTATSTLPNISATQLFIGGDYITDFTGTGLSVSSGVLSASGGSSLWVDGSGFLYPKDGDYAAAPYFTATSTSATSTFAYDVSISGQLKLLDANGSISIGDTEDGKRGNQSVNIRPSGSASAEISSGTQSTAVGYRTQATGNQSTAVGYVLDADGLGASAFGYGSDANSDSSTSVGYLNIVSSTGASAFGRSNSISSVGGNSDNAIAVGYSNFISSGSLGGVAVGYDNTLSANGAIAIGASITNGTANSLMIGPSNTSKLSIYSGGESIFTGFVDAQYFVATSTTATSTFAGNISVDGGKNLAIVASDGDYRYVYMDTAQVLNFSGGAGNTATLNAAGAWGDASDIAYKENIEDLAYGLNEVMQLNPRSYNFKNIPNEQYIGFIAQELEQIIPEVVYGEDGHKTVSYGQLTSVLTKAIQELSYKVELIAGKIVDGVVHFGEIAVERLAVKNLSVGDKDNVATSGITIIDRVTGEPVCIYVADGETHVTDGACGLEENKETGSPTNNANNNISSNSSVNENEPVQEGINLQVTDDTGNATTTIGNIDTVINEEEILKEDETDNITEEIPGGLVEGDVQEELPQEEIIEPEVDVPEEEPEQTDEEPAPESEPQGDSVDSQEQ